MGTIKDVVDLVTQLAGRVKDRKVASELNAIQSLILSIQSDHAKLHDTNIKLREESLSLKEQIQELEAKLAELSSASSAGPSGVPTCPNCSTQSKPFYMRPVPKDFVQILNATHECPGCKYRMKINS